MKIWLRDKKKKRNLSVSGGRQGGGSALGLCRHSIRPHRGLVVWTQTQPVAAHSRAYYAGNAKRISAQPLEIMWKMRRDVVVGGNKKSRTRQHQNNDSVHHKRIRQHITVTVFSLYCANSFNLICICTIFLKYKQYFNWILNATTFFFVIFWCAHWV